MRDEELICGPACFDRNDLVGIELLFMFICPIEVQ